LLNVLRFIVDKKMQLETIVFPHPNIYSILVVKKSLNNKSNSQSFSVLPVNENRKFDTKVVKFRAEFGIERE